MKSIQVAAAIIMQANEVLIAKRPMDKHKGGYWEFPGGKIETGESAVEALSREIYEELNIRIVNPQAFYELSFRYPEKQVELEFFLVESFDGEPRGMEQQQIRWVPVKELAGFQFPEANQPVVEKLMVGTIG